MPAQSKQQVRLMRLVRGVQTGDTPKSKVDAKVKKMAKDMDPADVKDFAKTPESGLPEKKKQKSLNEGEWSKIMAGVKKGDQSGPWSLVVIDGITKKVKHQKDVKVRNAIPAYYEDLKKKFKGDFLSIEDKSGQQVYKGRLEGSVKESAPEGWEKTVKAMKKHKDIDNPWALAHWMKGKGYQSKKESFIKSELNEDVNFAQAILLANAGAAIGGALAFIYNHLTLPPHYEYRSMWQRVKDWWSSGKDKAAIEKIVKRLNADPEVIAFAKNKKSTGWKELLKKKLTGSEMSYLNKIYKTQIQPKEEQVQPHSGQEDLENNPSVYKNAPQVKEGPKVKPKQSITKQEWDKTPKDYKAVIDGVKYKMMNTDKGTSLVSVNVTEAMEDCGCNNNEQNIHTSNKLSLKTAMNGIKTK